MLVAFISLEVVNVLPGSWLPPCYLSRPHCRSGSFLRGDTLARLTSEEVDYFRRARAKGTKLSSIAKRLQRSEGAVRKLVDRIDPKKGHSRAWRAEEDKVLNQELHKLPTKQVAELLPGRSVRAVHARALALGIIETRQERGRPSASIPRASLFEPVREVKTLDTYSLQHEIKPRTGNIPCLCCREPFLSEDRVRNRMCAQCKRKSVGFLDHRVAV